MGSIVNATAPAQIPLDMWNWDQDGKLVYAQDLRGSVNNIITEYDWEMADVFNYTNGVLGTGLQVSAGSGMTYSISTGRARALNCLKVVQLIPSGQGLIGQPNTFTFTIPNGSSIPAGQSRIDIVMLRYRNYTYTDSVGTENHTVDYTEIDTVQGTPGSSPVAPSVPDSSYVKLAEITVHANDTTAGQTSIDNTKRTTLGSLGSTVVAVPIGTGIPYFGTAYADDGHFGLANGRITTIAAYPELYSAIGTTWGAGHGDGLSFTWPTSTDLYLKGAGTESVGTTSGANGITLTSTQLAAHTHNTPDLSHSHTTTESAHNHTQNAHAHTGSDSGHAHGPKTGSGILELVVSGSGVSSTTASYEVTFSSTTGTASANISIANTTATNNSNTTGLTVNNHSLPATATSSTGSGSTINNEPLHMVVNFLIRYR